MSMVLLRQPRAGSLLQVSPRCPHRLHCKSIAGPGDSKPLTSSAFMLQLFEILQGEGQALHDTCLTSHAPCSALCGWCAGGGPNRSFPIKFLNIMDPLLATNNLGRSVSKANFARIRKALAHGSTTLSDIMSQVCVMPLSGLIDVCLHGMPLGAA